jgi:6-phosphogluconolactonase
MSLTAGAGNTRRTVLAGLGVSLGTSVAASPLEKTVFMSKDIFAYVGCRTTRERNARGDGIAVYRLDASAWSHLQTVGGLFNPSYLAFDRDKRFVYTVHGDASEVSAFRINPDGTLDFLNRQSCQGKNPVHLVIDPSNRWLLVANHLTAENYVSNLAVLPRRQDGTLEPVSDLVPLTGKTGPHRSEQPFAKPHQLAFDARQNFIAVPDKGCDLVRVFRLTDAGKLATVKSPPMIARPGAGPRHIAFRPDGRLAYVVNELDSTLTACRYDPGGGALEPIQRLSSVPDSFTGYSTGSEIAVSASGRFVYASNRGDDSIGVFACDQDSGRLSPRGWVSCGGKTPRFFALSSDGASLYAANEDSDTITAFGVDPATGALQPRGVVIRTGSPTCILFSS